MDERTVRYLHKQNMKNHKRVYVSREGYKIKCIHEDGCFPIIGGMMREFNPQLVLELGCSWGGMTKMFEDYTKAEIHAYDTKGGRQPKMNQFGMRVNFHFCDLLSQKYFPLVELCQDKRRKLLYCDNGCKVKEIYMYGQYLNEGDMIAAHDYPREIYEDWNLLLPKMKKKISPENVDRMNEVLEDFEPVAHDLFLEKGFSDRFWIKVK